MIVSPIGNNLDILQCGKVFQVREKKVDIDAMENERPKIREFSVQELPRRPVVSSANRTRI
jgi:hypothetical protein